MNRFLVRLGVAIVLPLLRIATRRLVGRRASTASR
jgi:hypothetical protein